MLCTFGRSGFDWHWRETTRLVALGRAALPDGVRSRPQIFGNKNPDRIRRELCRRVVVIHAVDHILLGVRKAPRRQDVRRQCQKAGSLFVHRSHTPDIGAGACRGVGVDVVGATSLLPQQELICWKGHQTRHRRRRGGGNRVEARRYQ